MVIVIMINVEVAYADKESQRIIKLQLNEGSTIEQAIDGSGMLFFFPDIDLMQQKVGIFGKQKKLSDVLNEGDRVEIYRPLTVDPKEARKMRVRNK